MNVLILLFSYVITTTLRQYQITNVMITNFNHYDFYTDLNQNINLVNTTNTINQLLSF